MHALTVIILAFWIVALATTIVNLLAVPRLAARLPRSMPLVSVIVPARDEERAIESAVRALFAQTYPALELIVVDDRSTDATGAILSALAREDARLVVVDGHEPPPGWLGKPAALHRGSAHARGELLLFVDADVLYSPDLVTSAVAYLEEHDLPMVSLFPRLEMRGFWEHVIMPNLAVFAFSFLPLWLANRSRTPILAVGGGPGNLVRRADYDAVGGHESLKDAVVDDVALARLMRRSGRRTRVVRAEEMIAVRMYHGVGEIVRGFTKNAFAVFDRSYVAALFFLSASLVFHLLPYALALTGNRLAIAAVLLIVVSRVVLFRAIGYRLVNAVFGHPLMMLSWGYILIRSLWYTGIRRQLHWRGRTYDAGDTRFGAD